MHNIIITLGLDLQMIAHLIIAEALTSDSKKYSYLERGSEGTGAPVDPLSHQKTLGFLKQN